MAVAGALKDRMKLVKTLQRRMESLKLFGLVITLRTQAKHVFGRLALSQEG